MRALRPALLALLTACPAHEGPIDVILLELDDTAEISWSGEDQVEFVACENGTTSPEATVGCGPYGKGRPGDYTVRVVWQGITVDKGVTLEDDGSYLANTEVTFEAGEFVAAE